MIDGEVCAVGDQYTSSFFVIVPPEELKPGCGREGVVVSFAADGFAVEGRVPWRPTASTDYDEHILKLTTEAELAGPHYAYFRFEPPAIPDGYIGQPYHSLEAFIGGKSCGFAGGDEPGIVTMSVAPDEIDPGCGIPGAKIALMLQGKQLADLVWEAGFHEGPTVPDLNTHLYGAPNSGPFGVLPGTERPASSRILPPSVGDAGLR
jgi:hypothetical protein